MTMTRIRWVATSSHGAYREPVRHAVDPTTGAPMCGQRNNGGGRWELLSPQGEKLWEICHRCDRILNPPAVVEERPVPRRVPLPVFGEPSPRRSRSNVSMAGHETREAREVLSPICICAQTGRGEPIPGPFRECLRCQLPTLEHIRVSEAKREELRQWVNQMWPPTTPKTEPTPSQRAG